MSVLTNDQALQIWDRAVSAQGALEIKFKDMKSAQRARFVLYNVRKKARAEQAQMEDIPVDLVETDYDEYSISINLKDDACVMRITQNVPFDELEIIDTGLTEDA